MQKLRKLQKPQLRMMVLTADLRERFAECAEYAANSAILEAVFSGYRLAFSSNHRSYKSPKAPRYTEKAKNFWWHWRRRQSSADGVNSLQLSVQEKTQARF